jgi:hypothetical protein
MNTSPNPDTRRPLRTSDLAAAGIASTQRDESPEATDEPTHSPAVREMPPESAPQAKAEKLEALFAPDAAARYRTRWAEVQGGFVDDPQRAVAEGDELVAEVMQSLAESFAVERHRLEDELSHTGQAPTEALRVGLRRYRSFFERLLSL